MLGAFIRKDRLYKRGAGAGQGPCRYLRDQQLVLGIIIQVRQFSHSDWGLLANVNGNMTFSPGNMIRAQRKKNKIYRHITIVL